MRIAAYLKTPNGQAPVPIRDRSTDGLNYPSNPHLFCPCCADYRIKFEYKLRLIIFTRLLIVVKIIMQVYMQIYKPLYCDINLKTPLPILIIQKSMKAAFDKFWFGETVWRHGPWSTLFQVLGLWLDGHKPLPELMLSFRQSVGPNFLRITFEIKNKSCEYIHRS